MLCHVTDHMGEGSPIDMHLTDVGRCQQLVGGGGEPELFTCPYPLNVQACPPRDQGMAGYPVQGLGGGGGERESTVLL